MSNSRLTGPLLPQGSAGGAVAETVGTAGGTVSSMRPRARPASPSRPRLYVMGECTTTAADARPRPMRLLSALARCDRRWCRPWLDATCRPARAQGRPDRRQPAGRGRPSAIKGLSLPAVRGQFARLVAQGMSSRASRMRVPGVHTGGCGDIRRPRPRRVTARAFRRRRAPQPLAVSTWPGSGGRKRRQGTPGAASTPNRRNWCGRRWPPSRWDRWSPPAA